MLEVLGTLQSAFSELDRKTDESSAVEQELRVELEVRVSEESRAG